VATAYSVHKVKAIFFNCLSSSGDLFIVPSKTTDSGLYTCSYKTADGSIVSVETELAVEQKCKSIEVDKF
jgi:uncharacterized protein (UPF0179 family)